MQGLRAVLLLAFAWPAAALGDDIPLGADARSDLAITIYNDDLALVRDVRKVDLKRGEHRLAFADVSALIRPETAALAGPFTVLEQNFDYDLISPESLLTKAVGGKVRLHRRQPDGSEAVEEAQILAASGGVVLKIGDRIEAGAIDRLDGRIVFDHIPENLRARPTLSMLVKASGGKSLAELRYLSSGLGWAADYVGSLSPDGNSMRLDGMITLRNHAGVAFNDALVQLVAGDVHQVAAPDREMVTVSAARKQAVTEQNIGDYHLYTLPRRTSIADAQTKQVGFLSAPKVKLRKSLRYVAYAFQSFEQPDQVTVLYQFDNRAGSGLGMPLPRGVVRLYAEDKDGHAQFIGEDRIGHVPATDTVTLETGRAFDIAVRGAKLAQTSIARDENGETLEITQQYRLTNGGDQPATVELIQENPGQEWTVLSSEIPAEQQDADRLRFLVNVPAKGESSFQFQVRVRQ